MAVNPVIVIPVYTKGLNRFEQISLKHLRHFLFRHRLVMVKPETLDWSISGLESVSFHDRFFQSKKAYNQLMLSTVFYERFKEHSHILLYQLDALVFRDELTEWCKTDFDYIGASWYPALMSRYEGFEWLYVSPCSGNGGFSLRRVEAFLDHLQRRQKVRGQALRELLRGNLSRAMLVWKYRRHLDPANYVPHESLNEDVYYGVFAPIFQPSFRVAPPEISDSFSFEYSPYHLFRKTGGRLPFGCHAWQKSPDSLEFWTPYLLTE